MEQAELLELRAHQAEFIERLRKEGKMCAVMGDFVIPKRNPQEDMGLSSHAREGFKP